MKFWSTEGIILKILAKLTGRTGFDSALQAVCQALLYQTKDSNGLKSLYRSLYTDVPELPAPTTVGWCPQDIADVGDSVILWQVSPEMGAVNGW